MVLLLGVEQGFASLPAAKEKRNEPRVIVQEPAGDFAEHRPAQKLGVWGLWAQIPIAQVLCNILNPRP